MESSKSEKFKERLLRVWENITKRSEEESIGDTGSERTVVFIVSLILALCLWLMVNLSRDYNLNIKLPVALGAVPEDRALAESLPETATVSLMGEGWKLINIYNNPPVISVDVGDSDVNLYAQVQQQLNALPKLRVQKVQPLILTLNLEERITKKIPVHPNVKVSFEEQFGFIGSPDVQPDSITISGAASLVEDIEAWPTDSVSFTGVAGDISRVVELKSENELISLSQNQVIYNAAVAQFTEGEAEVEINTKNLPEGRNVSYSPTSIMVKYDVPVSEFPEVEDMKIFKAYVTYDQLLQDSTGFVTPQIEQIISDKYHIKIRSIQPNRVAYFMVLD